jgi:hypothetical protein
MQRRTVLQLLAGSALLQPLSSLAAAVSASSAVAARVSATEVAFLEDLQRRGCLYFSEQVGASSGQVLDRAAAVPTPLSQSVSRDPRSLASIAATGFGLTALCIAEFRGYQPRTAVIEQLRRTLRFHLAQLPHEHGFLYHFNHVDRGEPARDSEVSPIDTALLLAGALTARARYPSDPEIVQLATRLYERVDWPWMLNGGQTLALGWRDGKFLPGRWNHYCELMMLYLLAIGSPTHPIAPAAWQAFSRPHIKYAGLDYISGDDPLFVHQYSHAWFDFRHQRDQYADYFVNSVLATRAHKAFCLSLGKPYTDDYWGISASDSAHGYTGWGGPSARGQGFGGIDGSVVPCAAAGSLPFAPAACLRVLRALKARYPRAYGRYGFCDAFHPEAGWYDPDVLGIDLGIGVLMAENLRTGFVWDTFARNPEVPTALRKAGFYRI